MCVISLRKQSSKYLRVGREGTSKEGDLIFHFSVSKTVVVVVVVVVDMILYLARNTTSMDTAGSQTDPDMSQTVISQRQKPRSKSFGLVNG